MTTSFSADDLDFQLNIAIFPRYFFSSADLFNLPLNFSIFRKRRRRSAENLNFRAKI
jgi:hypothetical protein